MPVAYAKRPATPVGESGHRFLPMATQKEQPPRKLSGKWTVGGGHSGKQAAASRRRLTEGVNGVVAGGVMMLSGPMTERGSASGRSDDGATDSVGGKIGRASCRERVCQYV